MFELFLKYVQATNNTKSMKLEDCEKSGLTKEEFIFIYDHFDQIKKDYAVIVALAIAFNSILDRCDMKNPVYRNAKAIRYKIIKYIENLNILRW